MSKIIFWLIIIFAVLFLLRIVNANKARRREQANRAKNGAAHENTAMVRCVRCGVFLPRVDAMASAKGFTCGDAACASNKL